MIGLSGTNGNHCEFVALEIAEGLAGYGALVACRINLA